MLKTYEGFNIVTDIANCNHCCVFIWKG